MRYRQPHASSGHIVLDRNGSAKKRLSKAPKVGECHPQTVIRDSDLDLSP